MNKRKTNMAKETDQKITDFFIDTVYDNGSGMKFKAKEELLKEISLMIDDCAANGGTYFALSVDTDASCFLTEDDE